MLFPQRIGPGREHAVPPEEEQRDVSWNRSTDTSLCGQVLFLSQPLPALCSTRGTGVCPGHLSELGGSSTGPGLFPTPTQAASQTPALLPPRAVPQVMPHGHCPNKDCAQPGQAFLQHKAKGFLIYVCPGQLPTDGVSALHISTGHIWKQALLCNVKRFVHQNSPWRALQVV